MKRSIFRGLVIGLTVGIGLALTSCVQNCEYLFTDEYIERDFYGREYLVIEDVYECNTIVRDRVLQNNGEVEIEDLN